MGKELSVELYQVDIFQKTLLGKWKDKPQTVRNYL